MSPTIEVLIQAQWCIVMAILAIAATIEVREAKASRISRGEHENI